MSENGSENKKTAISHQVPVFRIQLIKDNEMIGNPINNAQDVVDQVQDVALSDREQFVCLFLNTKNRPLGRQIVSIGSLNSSLVHPREVFKGAILKNASRILLVHNHPSGNPLPSKEDDVLTKRLAKAGSLLDIPVLDHVIVCPGGDFFSYQEEKPDLL